MTTAVPLDTFTVTVADEVEVTAPGDQTYTMDTAITDLALPEAAGGTTPVTYTLAPLPNGLIFNADTRVLSGTPTAMETVTATYTATDDNGSTAMDTFTVIVAAGVAVTAPDDQNYTMDTAITDLTLPEAAGGTAPLTYTLTSVPGLNFIPGTRTLSGTPTTADTTELTYEVTDTNGASTNATFTVTVNASLTLTASGNQTYTMDTAITALSLPMATGGTEPLTYALTGPGDSALPGGLSFNVDTRTLSGTPDTAGTTNLTYEVTDANDATTSVDFTVIVSASLVLDTPANQNYTMDTAITALSLPMATGGTEPLTYTLTGPGDSALPGGLSFNANTRTLSGTPSTPDTTTLTYEVTDNNGANTSVDFTVRVNASLTLDTPDDQNYTMDTAITDLTLDPATGGTTPVTYTLTGPSGAALATAIPGLNFDANNRTLSGTPNTTATTVLTYTATDDNGSTAMDTFTVTVADEVEVTAPGDQTYTMDTAITDLALAPATGGTGAVTYTLTPLPNGLIFNADTRVLSGTPTTATATELTYIATDDNGSTAMDTFTVTVADEVEVTAPGDQTYTMGTAITALTLTPATGGTTPVTYTLAPLPNGLLFNATTRVLSGTPNTTATTELTYTATDDNGSTAMDTFTVIVAARVAVTAPVDQTYTMDTAITDLGLPMATGGTGTVTYTLAPLPNGLIFNATTRVLSGTPTTTATTVLTYTATDDNGSTAMDTFTVTVADEAEVTAPDDQNYTMDTAITDLTLDPATGGTTPVTYTLTGPSGAALATAIPGLNFDANNRTLSGTPNTTATTVLTYTATDDNGSTAMDTFTVTVADEVEVTAPVDQTYTMDTAITDLTLSEAAGGTTPVTYTLAPLPNGLTFTAATRVLSGTPSTPGTFDLTYEVTDANGASTNATFTVIVSDGLALTASGNQNYTLDTAITALTLPEATGGTVPLTYTLTGPGDGNLPGGLTFGTRTLSGTPSTATTTTLTYAVTDDNGASTTATFMVTVNASLTLTASGNQNYTQGRAITALPLPEATGGTAPLTYTLTGPGGGNLPAGLTFNTRTLSGTPDTPDTFDLTYEVMDANGASTSVDFTVIVSDGLALTASGDQNYTLDTAIDALQLPEATGGTAPLTYTLTGPGDGALPGGLTFGTRTLSGTPDMAATTTLTYEVTDTNGASTTATFTVIVSDGLALTASANQNYTLDTEITDLPLPAATGGTGTLVYTLTGPGDSALPGGLTFGTRTLSGTPDMAATTTLTYAVSDANGASTSVDFTVTVNASLTLTASGDQNYTLDTAITALTLPEATGGTEPLTYTLTGPGDGNLPGGLTFGTRTLSGTPSTAGTTTLTYAVTDTNGASTSVDFTVIVSDGLALTASVDQTYTMDTAITALSLPMATGGTGTLTYTLTSVPGLTFTPGTRILSGTPDMAATTTLTYVVSDTNGASTSVDFTVIVSDGLALTASANQNYTLDTAITDLTLPAATGGTAPLTYTLTSVPGLTFTPATRILSGTPGTATTTTLTYRVMDANGASTSVDFTVIVSDGLALNTPANQNYTQNTLITDLPLPEATGGTGTLTYTLTSVPGLSFNANTRILSGTPDMAATTTLTYRVTDTNGASTSATFTVIVSDGLVLTASGNQNYTLDTAITALSLPMATGGTGTLQYTLTGPSGLPGGLIFNANTRILSGTPDMAATTTLTYAVSDANGASTSVDFTVIVSDGLALTASANQNYTLDTAITDLTLPAATGGTGTLTYTLTSVPGLTFTAGTRTLSGTPNTAGATTLTYEVTDTNGASTTATFTVIVSDGLALTASANQNYTLDTAITDLQLPEATGGTAPLTYTLTSVPGLTFTPGTRILSGTPNTAGTTTLTYRVTDTNGTNTNATFTVIVSDGLALSARGNQNYTLDTEITGLELPVATGGTGTLVYTLTSVPGLTFNANTRILSGTPSTAGTFDLTYMVTDTNGASTSVDFTVIVSDGLALSASGNQNYTLDTEITGLELPVATGGTGTLVYTLTSVPGLTFTPGTRTLSGTPSTAGTTTLTYEVTDTNGANTNATFTVIVSDGLALSARGNQNYTQGRAINNLELPVATGGTMPLTYTLTGPGDSALPGGLNFNAGTRTLSGTPNTAGTTTLTYRVTDTNGANTNATFTVIVSDGLALSASGNQNYTQNTLIPALQLPVATGGTGTLTYTLTSVPGLTFAPGTRTLSGTPDTAGTTILTYAVSDANGASTTATFMVTVNASLTLTASGNQNYTQGRAITALPLPEATGGTGTLTYTLTSVPGLTFNANTRILSGTPNTAGTTTLTYRVTDTNGASTSVDFTVIVNASLTLTASGDQNYTQGRAITDLQLPEATGGTAPLTYTLTGPGGGNLPAGLTFNTRTLSGTPDMAGTTTLTYRVTDTNGASTSVDFTVIVSDGLVLTASGNQNYTLDTAITALSLPMATGGTGTLQYTLTGPGGGNLPAGLTFNTRTLSGTPDTPDTFDLTYRVTDTNGASTSVDFTVIVSDGLALTASGDQNYTLDTAITDLQLPAATGGTGTLTYTLTSVPGLSFNANTRILSGTPDMAATTTLTYRVTDTNGASTSVDFTVIVSDGLVLTASGNQNYTLDTAITDLTLPVATGGTGTLTYTLTSVPGLDFDPGTRILSGTPTTAATTTLTYAVSDANGASTSVDFTVIVSDGLALSARGNQNYTLDTAITDLQLPAATGGTGTLQYTLTSVPGLTFTPGTRTLSGTPSTAATTTLTYRVTDTNGASMDATFTVIVSDGLALTASGNQNYTLDTAITDLQLPEATGGTAPLTYTLTSVPGLTFTPGTRTLSGTPNTAGTTVLTYEVTDTNNASTTATFMVTVNASLTLTASGDQNYTLDTEITALPLPVATGGTAPLTYTLTSVPGLTFTPGTRTLSGTPDTAGTAVLTYEVTDTNNASTSVDFTVIVSDGLALTASANQNYTLDTAITDLTLPAATGGTAPLTYTLTSVPGLTFTPGTRTLSGTPDTAGTTVLTYEVTDTNNASTTATFMVTVNASLTLTASGDQNYTLDTAINNLQLPIATGGTGTLQYTLTGPGDGNLPGGLTFGTRTLSGTPSMAATTTLTYRVTDTNGASTSVDFTVIVSDGLALNTPANQNYTQNTLIPALQLPVATGGTGTLTYTLTSVPGLDFDPGTRTLSGTPDTAGTTVLTYEVSDANNASTTAAFTVIVSDGLALTASGNQNYTLDTEITALPLPAATGGTVPLTYTLTSVPGLDFDPGTRTLSGTPDTAGTTVLTYEVSDANNASTTAAFTVIVSDGLALTASGNQNYTLDTEITALPLPAATGGTVPLTYTLTSVPGLDFDPGTRTLSGTPDTAGTTNLTYTVTDDNNASTTATFTVIVSDGLALSARGNQNYTLDTEITALPLPVATGGTGTLQYTLTGPSGLPGGLIFNASTRTLSGTPSTPGTTTLTYMVTDTNGANTSVDFMVTVNASLTLTASGNQNYTLDTAITALQLPVATGGTAPLTYTLTSVPGLDFDPGTRTLSGTPGTATTTTLDLRGHR